MNAWSKARSRRSRLSNWIWLVPAALLLTVALLVLKWQRTVNVAAAAHPVIGAHSPARPRAPAVAAPRELAVLVFKSERAMEVWGRDDANSAWRLLREFPQVILSGGAGPKLRNGDQQIPEGAYKLKTNSGTLVLAFPNEFDLQMARADGRPAPAGDVRIGDKAAAGRIALDPAVLQDLCALIEAVSAARVVLILAPNDLRKHVAVKRPGASPPWLNAFYAQLKVDLEAFKN